MRPQLRQFVGSISYLMPGKSRMSQDHIKDSTKPFTYATPNIHIYKNPTYSHIQTPPPSTCINKTHTPTFINSLQPDQCCLAWIFTDCLFTDLQLPGLKCLVYQLVLRKKASTMSSYYYVCLSYTLDGQPAQYTPQSL